MSSSVQPFEAIHPHYAGKFRCIGPACEDTCCQGWSVSIDKSTYTKYQQMPGGPLRVLVEERLERTANGSDLEYAKVRLDGNGVCAFLAQDRLCAIQKEHGEDYLSLTCAQYPRASKTIGGTKEQVLLLSCPEAAPLVLLDRQLIARPVPAQYQEFLACGAPPNPTPLAYFWPVRNLVVLLLQDRSYPSWQRVLLVHMFCKRLDSVIAAREWNRIPSLLSEHADMFATGRLRAALDSIPTQTAVQLGVVMTLIEARDPSGSRNRRFAECVEDFAGGIGHQPGSSPVDLTKNYLEAYRLHFQPWIAEHEFMLENYLLNQVFGNLFPFGKPGPEQGHHAYRESQTLCFRYGLIKGLLIGMAGHHRSSFGADHAVKLIQSFSKAVEHNARLLQRIENFFVTNSLNDVNGIAALIRDSAPGIPAQVPIAATQVPISPL